MTAGRPGFVTGWVRPKELLTQFIMGLERYRYAERQGAPRPMRRIRIAISYDGTLYHGWQVQPGLATIQGELERVISEIEGRPVAVLGSGRTDAGVHALAQVAAFDLENPIPIPNLVKAVNRLLPRDIRVRDAEQVDPGFHPRFQAAAKIYEYRILRDAICPPFDRHYLYHYPFPLDESKMIELAPVFEGEHDFSAFAASDEKDGLGHSKVRRIFSSRMCRQEGRLLYRVCGSGFLKHMVRNIAGVLLEAGKGNLDRASIEERLKPGCGLPSGPAAPARGLFLVSVSYSNDSNSFS